MIDSLTKNILVVEDEPGPRDSLKMILSPSFNVFTAEDAEGALRILKDHKIDLITLDLKLPDRQGMELLREIRLEQRHVEVIIITGYGSLESAIESIQYGVAGYILKPFNIAEVITVVNQTLEKKHHLDHLRAFLHDFGALWEDGPDTTTLLTRLSRLLSAKDPELRRHSRRTQSYSTLLADRLSLDSNGRALLEAGALLHDLGTIGIDEHLLATSHSLDERNLAIIKEHTEVGARIVTSLGFPADVGLIIRHHHEKYDGSGYPDRLRGEEIPLLARIVGLAQTFDHLVTGDPTHPGLSRPEALHRLRECAGHFDPQLVDLLARCV